MFEKLTLIGIGLIGSSIARAVKLKGLAKTIAITTRKAATLDEARSLGLGDIYTLDAAEAVAGADLVIFCTPIGVYADVMAQISGHLAPGAILSDVGSVKGQVMKALEPMVPAGVHFIPGHPIAGTEHSGPSAGFPDLFVGRWCVLTPKPEVDPVAVDRLISFWGALGSNVVEKIWQAGVNRCDADSDSDIDSADLLIIRNANRQNASSATDPRDGNGDGVINVADVRYCQLRCTRASCATQ